MLLSAQTLMVASWTVPDGVLAERVGLIQPAVSRRMSRKRQTCSKDGLVLQCLSRISPQSNSHIFCHANWLKITELGSPILATGSLQCNMHLESSSVDLPASHFARKSTHDRLVGVMAPLGNHGSGEPGRPEQHNWPGERNPSRWDVHDAYEVPEVSFLRRFKAALLLSEDADDCHPYLTRTANPDPGKVSFLRSKAYEVG